MCFSLFGKKKPNPTPVPGPGAGGENPPPVFTDTPSDTKG